MSCSTTWPVVWLRLVPSSIASTRRSRRRQKMRTSSPYCCASWQMGWPPTCRPVAPTGHRICTRWSSTKIGTLQQSSPTSATICSSGRSNWAAPPRTPTGRPGPATWNGRSGPASSRCSPTPTCSLPRRTGRPGRATLLSATTGEPALLSPKPRLWPAGRSLPLRWAWSTACPSAWAPSGGLVQKDCCWRCAGWWSSPCGHPGACRSVAGAAIWFPMPPPNGTNSLGKLMPRRQ